MADLLHFVSFLSRCFRLPYCTTSQDDEIEHGDRSVENIKDDGDVSPVASCLADLMVSINIVVGGVCVGSVLGGGGRRDGGGGRVNGV